jgi:hypothetical protein
VSDETRAIRLDDVRADGWFDRLAEDNETFSQLCEIIGERFVAFSVIAGVRITALSVDRRVPEATIVDFVLGEEGEEQRLTLAEFRRRLAAAIVSDEPGESKVEDVDALDADAIQELIGFRYVLLAPLFGVHLEELRVSVEGDVTILVKLGDGTEVVPLRGLRDAIRERVRAEVDRASQSSPFSIDLASIPEAETALEVGDDARVIELLGAWPGPLSILMRTADGQRLSPDVRMLLAKALGLLGTAYAQTARAEWAEEVLRLGIQWAKDGPVAGDLFRRLGQACVTSGRHGESIGYLRRALVLGAPGREVLPLLAASFAERGKWVAAALCAEEALVLGSDADEMNALVARAEEALGEAWTRFREVVPASRAASATIPAPRAGDE